MQKSTVNYRNPEQNTLCTAECKEGAAPQILLTTPCAEPQLWLTDHERKEDVSCWGSCQGHRYATDLQQEERGATPWLRLSFPGWRLRDWSILRDCCPLDDGELSLKGRNSHRPQEREPVLEIRFFKVLLYHTSVTHRLRTIKMPSGFPNKVGFIQFHFFPLHATTKHWKWSQLSWWIFFHPYVSASNHKLMAASSQFKGSDKLFH